MKRAVFESRGLRIESSFDWNGRFYIAWRPDVSQFLRERQVLLKWASYPTQTPTRAALIAWLDELDAADAQRRAPAAEPIAHVAVEGSFDPDAHADEDPALSTKMVL